MNESNLLYYARLAAHAFWLPDPAPSPSGDLVSAARRFPFCTTVIRLVSINSANLALLLLLIDHSVSHFVSHWHFRPPFPDGRGQDVCRRRRRG